ncbi:MAG: rRNA maturation RNase YbeY [Candidatus Krumholzibacteria bacterium]|nr:rRNA maturation RNase YbeY [Candidatus Krumholzibacteria bacterium]
MNLSLNRCNVANAPWLDDGLVDAIRRVGAVLDPAEIIVNFIVVDDQYIRELNRKYRDNDEPTDVITFSYLGDEGPVPEGEDDVAGEVYVSYQTIEKEAKELGVDTRAMFMHVGVHGLLHVVGFDHIDDDDAARMEREEKSLLSEYLDPDEMAALF